jgi:GntR family transcriptional regulator
MVNPVVRLELDRGSPVPLWRQVYAGIRERILDGTLSPGQRVPSEVELIQLTGVSRVTVRQALELLERERLIYRAGTKGAFVSERRIEPSLSILHGLSEKLEQLGVHVTSHVIHCERRQPDPETQGLLKLGAGDETYELERIRLVDGTPVAVQTAHLSVGLYPGLKEFDLAGSLTKLIRSSYGYDLASYSGSLEVISAGQYQAHHLRIPLGSPLLVLDGVTYSLSGVPLRRTLSIYRCDRFKFMVESFGIKSRGLNEQAALVSIGGCL